MLGHLDSSLEKGPVFRHTLTNGEHQSTSTGRGRQRSQETRTTPQGGGGGETKPKQDSKTTDATPQEGGWGDTMGGVVSGPASYIYICVHTHTNGSGFRVPDGRLTRT